MYGLKKLICWPLCTNFFMKHPLEFNRAKGMFVCEPASLFVSEFISHLAAKDSESLLRTGSQSCNLKGRKTNPKEDNRTAGTKYCIYSLRLVYVTMSMSMAHWVPFIAAFIISTLLWSNFHILTNYCWKPLKTFPTSGFCLGCRTQYVFYNITNYAMSMGIKLSFLG